MPEFNLPPQLEYLVKESTNDGRSLQQLFMDMIIEIFQTGRVPLVVDSTDDNKFQFVQYKAEAFINWKTAVFNSAKSLTLAVLHEQKDKADNIFSHDDEDRYRVLTLQDNKTFVIKMWDDSKELEEEVIIPMHMGKTLDEIPLIVSGSINNSVDIQPIPLVSVANCSVQIYRKEADLANSEFLSSNPTLVVVGAQNQGELPNVVGSSVMMVLPNEAARVFYTETDTAALEHVSKHIKDLYEEAIRHGVAILDARKGVEAAEALRIRQATQSASVYSIYLSALSSIVQGLKIMCKWSNINPDLIEVDAPTSLSFGVPDSAMMKELISGFADSGTIPLNVIHGYLVSAGLLDQTIGYEDYLKLLEENKELKKQLGIESEEEKKAKEAIEGGTSPKKTTEPSAKTKAETKGAEDKVE